MIVRTFSNDYVKANYLRKNGMPAAYAFGHKDIQYKGPEVDYKTVKVDVVGYESMDRVCLSARGKQFGGKTFVVDPRNLAGMQRDVISSPQYKGGSHKTLKHSYVVVDTETTGTNTYTDTIVELAAVKVVKDKVIEVYDQLINPGFPIPNSDIHGITNEMVENMPDLNTAMYKFLDFIGNDLIVGYNVKFDMNFIISNLPEGVVMSNKYCDILPMAKEIYKDVNLPNMKLSTLKEYLDVDVISHRADADCYTTHVVYQDIMYKKKNQKEDKKDA